MDAIRRARVPQWLLAGPATPDLHRSRSRRRDHRGGGGFLATRHDESIGSEHDHLPSCVPPTLMHRRRLYQYVPHLPRSYALGLDWPQPTATELTNLKSFFDLVASKGMKVDLCSRPRTWRNRRTQIHRLGWVQFRHGKGHPALDLFCSAVIAHTVAKLRGRTHQTPVVARAGNLRCGWGRLLCRHLSGVGDSLRSSHGIPANQISAEAIVGAYFLDSSGPTCPEATRSSVASDR